MRINKEYDIKGLKDVLKRQIDLSVKNNAGRVEINFITALGILDVLKETEKREEKHQTLESMCNFIEKEDGTQTNEFELHNKTDKNGNVLRTVEKYRKALEYFQKEKEAPNCFRHYDDKDSKCDNCEAKAGCAIATEEIGICGIIFSEEDTCCQWCDEYDNCLKVSGKDEQKNN